MDRLISEQAVIDSIEFFQINPQHFDFVNLIDDIKEIPSAEPKWIPVSERLPKEKEEVLVTTEWGEVTIGERYSTIDYFINDGAINANEDEIIAWMPLPKPYEQQESEGVE